MSAPTDIELSVLVCTFDAASRIAASLANLAAAMAELGVQYELVVVDDGSSDDTARRASTAVPAATVFRHDANLGAAAARNTAAALSRGEWLLFVDDDVLPDPDALRRIWRARRVDACVVPAVVDDGGVLYNSFVVERRFGIRTWHALSRPVPVVAFPVGACFLLPRVLYDRTGGFDERIYPNYFEDTAFGVELERVGSSTVMLSDVEVLHEMHGGDNSAERLEAIFDKVCRNRWVLTMVALRGRERLWTMAMGLPRTAARSLEARSLTPLRGYLYALRHLRALAAPKPAVGDVGRRGSWMDG